MIINYTYMTWLTFVGVRACVMFISISLESHTNSGTVSLLVTASGITVAIINNQTACVCGQR